jgi:hypothetical protein
MVCLLEERIVFAGQIHPNVYFYIQPDIASAPVAGANNFSSYEMFDLSFDTKKELFKSRAK